MSHGLAARAVVRHHHRMTASSAPRIAIHTAGLWRRTTATLLDAVPAAALGGVTMTTVASSSTTPLPPSQWNLLDRLVDTLNTQPEVLGWPLLWLMVAMFVWHFVTVASWGMSPGKRVVGLTMVDKHGDRVGPYRALAHALIRPLTLLCLAIGPLWMLADPERRTLYDRLSGVFVVSNLTASTTGNRRRAR